MKKEIINNLFEFWREIGLLTNTFIEQENYKAILDNHSDWPNRVFNSKVNTSTLSVISALRKENKLPGAIAIDGSINLEAYKNLDFVYNQINMSLDLNSYESTNNSNENIEQLTDKSLSENFAQVASDAFGYRVNRETISRMIDSKNMELYLYKEANTYIGCGIIFFDSLNNAGLHMIGTVLSGRAKGVGKKMTEKLINQAKKRDKKFCVLHSSKMGRPMYLKFGFQEFGEIKTYRIN